MSFRNPASLVVVLIALLLKAGEDVCVAEEFHLFPNAENGTLFMFADNIREEDAGVATFYRDSLIADVKITNNLEMWTMVTRKRVTAPEVSEPRSTSSEPLPEGFLLGPHEEKKFLNVEFPPRSTLQYYCTREDFVAYGVFAIDLILRGLFTTPLSPETLEDVLDSVGVELLATIGEAVGRDSEGKLFALATEVGSPLARGDSPDPVGVIQAVADFIISTKAFKAEMLEVVRSISRERAVEYTSWLGRTLGDLVDFIDIPQKIDLLYPLANDTLSTERTNTVSVYSEPISTSFATPPTARASDITGQPRVMTPEFIYSVNAEYTDPNGRTDLQTCNLALFHPTHSLLMMWYEADERVEKGTGATGEGFILFLAVSATPIPLGYRLNWRFQISSAWPERENEIDFGVLATDDTGLMSGEGYDFNDTNASFLLASEFGGIGGGDAGDIMSESLTGDAPTAIGTPTPGGGPGIPATHKFWPKFYIVRGGDPDEFYWLEGWFDTEGGGGDANQGGEESRRPTSRYCRTAENAVFLFIVATIVFGRPSRYYSEISDVDVSSEERYRTSMRKKYTVIATIIILAIAGGVYLWQKSADPYKNWKTYRNEEVGYSVRYPSDYNLEKRTPTAILGDIVLDDIVFRKSNEKKEVTTLISLKFYQNPLTPFFDFESEQLGGDNVKYSFVDTQEITREENPGDFDGGWFELSGNDGSVSIITILLQEEKKKFFRVAASLSSKATPQDKEILKQFIASIQTDKSYGQEGNQQKSDESINPNEYFDQFQQLLIEKMISRVDKETAQDTLENLKEQILETYTSALNKNN